MEICWFLGAMNLTMFTDVHPMYHYGNSRLDLGPVTWATADTISCNQQTWSMSESMCYKICKLWGWTTIWFSTLLVQIAPSLPTGASENMQLGDHPSRSEELMLDPMKPLAGDFAYQLWVSMMPSWPATTTTTTWITTTLQWQDNGIIELNHSSA